MRDSWECKMVQTLWKRVWYFLHKLTVILPYDSTIPCLGYNQEEKNLSPHKDMYVSIHSSIIHKSQKIETTQMSTNYKIDIVWYEIWFAKTNE